MRPHETASGVYIIRKFQLAERWNCSDMTISRMERRGDLPPATKISKGITGWRSDVIEAIEAERTPPAPVEGR